MVQTYFDYLFLVCRFNFVFTMQIFCIILMHSNLSIVTIIILRFIQLIGMQNTSFLLICWISLPHPTDLNLAQTVFWLPVVHVLKLKSPRYIVFRFNSEWLYISEYYHMWWRMVPQTHNVQIPCYFMFYICSFPPIIWLIHMDHLEVCLWSIV